MRRLLPLLLLAPLLPSSCVSGLEEERPLASLDEAFFRCKVQPVLTKNCATFACHGNGTRFFRLFGRNRLRLGGTEAERNAFLRDTERATNFTSTRAFVDVDRPEESLLLMKPLAEAAGGYYHGAADDFALRDVFTSKDDPEYQVLVSWVQGAKEDPACIEPGSDL